MLFLLVMPSPIAGNGSSHLSLLSLQTWQKKMSAWSIATNFIVIGVSVGVSLIVLRLQNQSDKQRTLTQFLYPSCKPPVVFFVHFVSFWLLSSALLSLPRQHWALSCWILDLQVLNSSKISEHGYRDTRGLLHTYLQYPTVLLSVLFIVITELTRSVVTSTSVR